MLTFQGLANASAALALDEDRFILADDEKKALYLYSFARSDDPPEKLSLNTIFGAAVTAEPDIEGAAAIGETQFWITSHTPDKTHNNARSMLFATNVAGAVDGASNGIALNLTGRVYRDLLPALAKWPPTAAILGLGRKGAEKKIDIEGLASDGKESLLIGFRTPLAGESAIMLEIRNAKAVIDGKEPEFSAPILLDLGGRGIRSVECVENGYLLVGGPPKGKKKSKLFFWSGKSGDTAVMLDIDLPAKFNPEGVFLILKTGNICVLSDDGKFFRGDKQLPGPPRFRAVIRSLDKILPWLQPS